MEKPRPTRAPIVVDVREFAESFLYGLLRAIRRHGVVTLRLRARDDVREMRLICRPLDASAKRGPRAHGDYPGSFLSPVEQAVWDALAGQALGGKALARVTHQSYGPLFRGLLANLVHRGVLVKSEHCMGYRRAT
jgi:hypothetical protein